MKDSLGLSKNKIKYLQALRHKKHRQKYNKFIVEGDKIARELLVQDRFVPELIFATSSWIKTNQSQLKFHLNRTLTVTEQELKLISNLSTPNQVLAVVDQHPWEVAAEPELTQGLSLYLDGIRDPGNMGTIIRIADWFGVDHIFCSADCVDVHMPKVVQAAMGAIFRVPVVVRDLASLSEAYPQWPSYGMVLDGENMYQMELPAQALIVVGNESRGISPEALSLIKHKIQIPPAGKSGAESLNAAIATGICCALFRQSS